MLVQLFAQKYDGLLNRMENDATFIFMPQKGTHFYSVHKYGYMC